MDARKINLSGGDDKAIILSFQFTTAKSAKLVQEGRRQEAEGRRQESLYSKLFNLFQLDSYLCHAALVALDATKCDRFNRSINSNQRSSFHPSPVITAAR